MRNRQYHPGLGRFLQTDPIGYAGGINLYAYVGGDPVNLVDPWGLSQCYLLGDMITSQCPGPTVFGERRRGLNRHDFDLIRWVDGGYGGGGGGGGEFGGGGEGAAQTPPQCLVPPITIGVSADAYAVLGFSVSGGIRLDSVTGQVGFEVQIGVGGGGGVNAGGYVSSFSRNSSGHGFVNAGGYAGGDAGLGGVGGGMVTYNAVGTNVGGGGAFTAGSLAQVGGGAGTPAAFAGGQVNGGLMSPSLWDPGC